MEDKAFRDQLEVDHSRVWNTSELQEDYQVDGFSQGMVIVRRKSDNVLGSMEFTHRPRLYYNFVADSD